jgi:uncharacterized membrane protein YkvA (DUF1232 family)
MFRTPKRPGSIRPEDEKGVHAQFEESLNDARRRSGFLRGLLDDARTLYAMLRDPNHRFDWGTRAKIIFALVYFISPLDILPDFIPGVGYIDDAVVLTLVVRSIGEAVRQYRKTRGIKGGPSNTANPSRSET